MLVPCNLSTFGWVSSSVPGMRMESDSSGISSHKTTWRSFQKGQPLNHPKILEEIHITFRKSDYFSNQILVHVWHSCRTAPLLKRNIFYRMKTQMVLYIWVSFANFPIFLKSLSLQKFQVLNMVSDNKQHLCSHRWSTSHQRQVLLVITDI